MATWRGLSWMILGVVLWAFPTAARADGGCDPSAPPVIDDLFRAVAAAEGSASSSPASGGGYGGAEQGPTDEAMADFAALEDVSAGDAPETIRLPDALVAGMQSAWEASFPRGRAREQGGVLVVDAQGHYAWQAGEPGVSGSWSPNYDDVGRGERLVAVGHTHPYDGTEGGYTDVPFSGRDLARLLLVEEDIAVVQSGDGVFVAAMTRELRESAARLDDQERLDLFYEIEGAFDEAFAKARGSFPERVSAAVDAVADRYGFVWYRGSGSTLSRVDD